MKFINLKTQQAAGNFNPNGIKQNSIYKIFALAVALLLNICFLIFLPFFADRKAMQMNPDLAFPVHIMDFIAKKEQPLEREMPKEVRKVPIPTKMIPTVILNHGVLHTQSPNLTGIEGMDIDVPAMHFAIHPGLAEGMPVSVPAGGSAKGGLPGSGKKGFFNYSEVDQIPKVLYQKKPIYPFQAKQRKISGKVHVKFLVDEKGTVSRVKILKSTPKGVFEKSVLQALPGWKFSPGKLKNQPVKTWVITSIRFELEH